ncbi:hypothetical protein TRFO_06418 [Tritrichomonas foetus]|uniref:Peroxin-12 n=1 Tax=Tritrichomonas foetus TaxID=1144522 RepID=A0A1J4JYR6_9EUKA|nr:hypothetical protein TRFO_06418 [Tritrichomonas foetus]|eukprot:OHT04115.1 hypothetical protein TRFO_06418 [Tritrichomonas foetus]
MLKLYLRALRAQDTKALEQIAVDASRLYITESSKKREKSKRSFGYSLYLTALESQCVITNTPNIEYNFSLLHVFSYSTFVPLSFAMEPTIEGQLRIAATSIFHSLPWSSYLRSSFTRLGIPYRYHTNLSATILTFYQVMSIKIAHGTKLTNIFDTAYKTALVTFINLCSRKLTTYVHKKLYFLPEWVISGFFAYYTAPFIQKFVRYGLIETLTWMLESAIHFVMRFTNDRLILPEDHEVPNIFMCSICRDFLNEPVELSGFFFCNDCLNMWFNKGLLAHPYTGENVSREMVSQSFLMKTITRRYKKLAIDEQQKQPNA